MKTYICPFCKKKQSIAIEWQTIEIAWKYDLITKCSKTIDQGCRHSEAWTCPNCGEDLPFDICEKIRKTLIERRKNEA